MVPCTSLIFKKKKKKEFKKVFLKIYIRRIILTFTPLSDTSILF